MSHQLQPPLFRQETGVRTRDVDINESERAKALRNTEQSYR